VPPELTFIDPTIDEQIDFAVELRRGKTLAQAFELQDRIIKNAQKTCKQIVAEYRAAREINTNLNKTLRRQLIKR